MEKYDVFSAERIGFIALIGSLLTSFLVIYKPVDRHLLPYLAWIWYRGKRIFTPRQFRSFVDATRYSTDFLETENRSQAKPTYVVLAWPYTSASLHSRPLDRTKGVLASELYTILLLLATGTLLISFPPPNLSSFLSPLLRVLTGGILLVMAVFVYTSLRDEMKELKKRLWFEAVYLMAAADVISIGETFEKLETALVTNDWAAAEFWTDRAFVEGGFFPRWPTGMDIDLENMFSEVQKTPEPSEVKTRKRST